jgi:hypothetical protein
MPGRSMAKRVLLTRQSLAIWSSNRTVLLDSDESLLESMYCEAMLLHGLTRVHRAMSVFLRYDHLWSRDIVNRFLVAVQHLGARDLESMVRSESCCICLEPCKTDGSSTVDCCCSILFACGHCCHIECVSPRKGKMCCPILACSKDATTTGWKLGCHSIYALPFGRPESEEEQESGKFQT